MCRKLVSYLSNRHTGDHEKKLKLFAVEVCVNGREANLKYTLTIFLIPNSLLKTNNFATTQHNYIYTLKLLYLNIKKKIPNQNSVF